MDDTASLLIYIVSACRDLEWRDELEKHLKRLVKQDSIWHRDRVLPGTLAQQVQSSQIAAATIIFVLLSIDTFEECDPELELVLASHTAGKAHVIPIIIRAIDFQDTPFADFQCLPRNGLPLAQWPDRDSALATVVKEIRTVINPHVLSQKQYSAAKVQKLQALLADHQGFMQDRLGSFVGRQQELAAIQKRINEKMTTGGYVTITGQAGQGKSSIIARLVEQYGPDTTAFHFIPLSPGPDHQIGLLRNLMARLILKYDLSDLYVASDNRAALRDYFPKALWDVAVVGGQEVIFIDGLDQLEEDLNGVRDLSFLPNNLPPGIVFVLGTRPNDTLQPLRLLSPLGEYRLPNLSRQDFDLILAHRQVQLEPVLADQFYQLMEQNALYLDLVAKELVEAEHIPPAELIARLAHNPSNLFSLSIARFKRQPLEWREVLKPILGLLLAAREPLGLHSMRTILNIEDDRLRDGIRRLGGLLTDTGQQRYALYHLKLRDYLKQDEHIPQKEYVFAMDEEEHYHTRLQVWCEQGSLSRIWEDAKDPAEQERRLYSRKHLIAHCYFAHQGDRLFAILDDGSYGRAKERYDVSTRSYIQDLDFGRRAAAWDGWTQGEALAYLPRLWQYTLLRCSLRSRSDNYPDELFLLMLLLGREQEVLGHAELLTDPVRKTATLQMVAEYLATQSGRQAESEQLFRRVHELAWSIKAPDKQVERLGSLTKTLAEVQNWELAEEVAQSIIKIEMQALALIELGSSLAKVQEWEQAERVWRQTEEIARSITESNKRDKVLEELDRARRRKRTRVVQSLIKSHKQTKVWIDLAEALAGVQEWEQAEKAEPLWEQAEEVAHAIKDSYQQAHTLRELVRALAQAQRWEQAEEVMHSIKDSYIQVKALQSLVESLLKHGHHGRVISLVQLSWLRVETRTFAFQNFSSVTPGLLALQPDMGIALHQAFQWVDAFLSGKDH